MANEALERDAFACPQCGQDMRLPAANELRDVLAIVKHEIEQVLGGSKNEELPEDWMKHSKRLLAFTCAADTAKANELYEKISAVLSREDSNG